MDWTLYIYKTIFLVIIFLITLVIAMYSTYGERKVAAFMQDRNGPNRAGPFGLLQPLADGVKMFMKEEIIPTTANKKLFILGPSIAMTTAMLTGVVIPWGGTLTIGSTEFSMQIADLNIGILYVFAMVSIGVYGIMIGGWASNNKYALLGSIRAASQMISYEIAMGMSNHCIDTYHRLAKSSRHCTATTWAELEHFLPTAGISCFSHLCLRRNQPCTLRPSGV